MYIAIEGCDGAGKSAFTQATLTYVKDILNKKAIYVREPGGTPLGEDVRELVLRVNDLGKFDDVETLLLMCTSRCVLARTVIVPALEKGHVIVSDRGPLSTWVYQGHKNEITQRIFTAVHNHLPEPDLTILVTAPLDTLAARRHQRQEELDAIELQGLEKQQEVDRLYRQVADASEKVCMIENTGALEDIPDLVYKTLDKFMSGGI